MKTKVTYAWGLKNRKTGKINMDTDLMPNKKKANWYCDHEEWDVIRVSIQEVKKGKK